VTDPTLHDPHTSARLKRGLLVAVGSDGDDLRRAPPQAPPAENTAEKQRVRQQMLARNWHDDAISSELGSFRQKSHLIASLIDIS
jgi:hypothetical protein